MKRNKKNKEAKLIKTINEDTNQVGKFFLILFGLIIIMGLLYVLTSKNLNDNSVESTETTISYTTVNVGNVFNRPYDNYYVLAYDLQNDENSLYSISNNYMNESGSKKLYTLDLGLKVNQKYVKEVSNKNATKPNELSLTNPTLIEIENGKIIKYYDTVESIQNVLK